MERETERERKEERDDELIGKFLQRMTQIRNSLEEITLAGGLRTVNQLSVVYKQGESFNKCIVRADEPEEVRDILSNKHS